MEPSVAAVRLDGVAGSHSGKPSLSLLTPGYETLDQQAMGFDSLSWCSSASAYPPSAFLGSGYPNTTNVLLNWPTSAAPLALMSCGLESPLLSPDPWAAETDSDGGDLFSPMSDVNAAGSTDSQRFQTVANLTAVGPSSHLKRSSWSEESSTTRSPAPSVDDFPADKPKRNKTKAHARKHSIQLRTAARKPRKAASIPLAVASAATATSKKPASISEEEEDDLTPEERRARRNHNIVEKQYRNRLNAQFERLLAVLPVEQCRAARAGGATAVAAAGAGAGSGAGDRIMRVDNNSSVGDEKRLSKAEVLDLATRRIRALEAEREKLWKERKELLRSLEVLMAGAVGMRQGVAGQVPVVGLGGPVGRV